jgi:hypothetical protein
VRVSAVGGLRLPILKDNNDEMTTIVYRRKRHFFPKETGEKDTSCTDVRSAPHVAIITMPLTNHA